MVEVAGALERRLLSCWGKTGHEPSDYHPALFHMLDVANVARELLTGEASPRWRLALASALGTDGECLADWLPWLVALHDIGKISAAFQGSSQGQIPRLQAEGFHFGEWFQGLDVRHTTVGAVFVADHLAGLCQPAVAQDLAGVWADVVGGHHGRFGTADSLRQTRTALKFYEPPEWHELRLAGAAHLSRHLVERWPDHWPAPANLSATIMCLCGFTSLCDWIASNGLHFRPEAARDFEQYVGISAVRAREAVQASGFRQPSRSTAPTSFTVLFSDLPEPRPLQLAVDAIPASVLAAPCLAIIEAPTGEGKTEAALALAHRLAQASGSDELYYALPTTATSNQMFGRVQRHLRDHLGLPIHVKLVHGQAFLVEDDLRIEPLAGDEADEETAAMEWFAPRKRSLLAPFGVGTIDQAELAALNVRYGALRMIGLAGKVLILDEVHAYDTYMTAIVERLLEWLAALGTSVIVLSATLPRARRAALIRAYGTAETARQDLACYPNLWVGGCAGSYQASPPAQQRDRRLALHPLHFDEDDPEARAHWLLDTVAGGGCACWIANTVRRAQGTFACLQRLAPPGTDLLLLHAQFPLEDRQCLEKAVSDRYGPQGERPARGIVVGTQVLEQSLDLDFDVMASDLAPIDLLLQRAGRLHRHARPRPAALDEPCLCINYGAQSEDGLKTGVDRYIYAEFILQQTWLVLAGRSHISLPADYRSLIEAVYDAGEPPRDSPLHRSWLALRDQQTKDVLEARLRLLAEPDPEWPFCASMAGQEFEEDEDRAAWIVARTRLGEESLTVIPLERTLDWARLYPGQEAVRLGQAAAREEQLRLLRRSLRISRPEAVKALRAEAAKLPPLFARSPLLKGCFPLWLINGQARLPLDRRTLVLTLDPRLGLVITKEGE